MPRAPSVHGRPRPFDRAIAISPESASAGPANTAGRARCGFIRNALLTMDVGTVLFGGIPIEYLCRDVFSCVHRSLDRHWFKPGEGPCASPSETVMARTPAWRPDVCTCCREYLTWRPRCLVCRRQILPRRLRSRRSRVVSRNATNPGKAKSRYKSEICNGF